MLGHLAFLPLQPLSRNLEPCQLLLCSGFPSKIAREPSQLHPLGEEWHYLLAEFAFSQFSPRTPVTLRHQDALDHTQKLRRSSFACSPLVSLSRRYIPLPKRNYIRWANYALRQGSRWKTFQRTLILGPRHRCHTRPKAAAMSRNRTSRVKKKVLQDHGKGKQLHAFDPCSEQLLLPVANAFICVHRRQATPLMKGSPNTDSLFWEVTRTLVEIHFPADRW